MKRALRNLKRNVSSKQIFEMEKAPTGSSLEILESRVFLSGNVVAQVVNGSVSITGDTGANVIFLNETRLKAHQIRIIGTDGTDINGQAGSVILNGVKGDALIQMSSDGDNVSVSDMSFPGNVRIVQGGADTLALDNVTIAKSFILRNGSTVHTTVTTLTNTEIGKNFQVISDNGLQNIVMQGFKVHGDTIIQTGKRSDDLTINDSVFRRDATLDTGAGADTLDIETSGNPSGPTTTFDGTAAISMGTGDDTVQLGVTNEDGNSVAFANKVHLDGGTGDNTVNNFNASFVSPPRIRDNDVNLAQPTVSSTDPLDGATAVPVNRAIAATFSEAMDAATITAANVSVTAPNNVPVAGTVTFTGTTMTFTPTNDLAANTLFTAKITTGVTDSAGIHMADDFVWSFTSGAAPDTTAPIINSVNPDDNQSGVALNHVIEANFSEAMDPATINSNTVIVTGPGSTPVSGTVSLIDLTMFFTPNSNSLAPNTTFTATITTGAKDLAGNPLANNNVWHFTTGAAPDTTAPTVSSTDPAIGATGVTLNKAIAATFSEAMAPSTISTANYTLKGPSNSAVVGTVTLVGNTATFTPTSNLAANTLYTATISIAATDLAGNPLASAKVWTFTTGAAPDVTPPTVSSTSPANNDTGVALNTAIAATFSESMDSTTISAASYTVQQFLGSAVTGTVTLFGNTATFTPTSNLAANTQYIATISTAAKDLAGNALASSKVWSFTTGSAADTTPPTVSSTDPVNTATGVTLNKAIAATFSESMDATTINNVNYTVSGPGNSAVAGAVTLVGSTATFTPNSNLSPNTLYTATISTAAKDLAGNPLATAKVWTFTTGAAPDVTPPTVSSTDPADTATGVTLNKAIAATFSEAMDSSTISTATYTLQNPNHSLVTGTVTYVGTTATFTPASDLTANTVYTATIGRAAQDLAGNGLAAAKVWTFTTGSAADTTPPTVSSTDPANAATAVTLNKAIAATFSESMDATTISTATFTLTGPSSTSVAGAVTLVGTTATFTPNSNLAPNTTFTATISTAAKDLAGNALASAKVWTFTTGAAPDVTPPTVSSTDPANAATGVTLNKAIAATFSESMDATTINNVNYTLTGPGSSAVAGTVTLVGTTATFTPNSNLAANTTFTATISTAAKDLAGNALATAKVWTFTTGAAPDVTPPTVSSTDPADAATGVALNKAIAATFSESMDATTINNVTYTLTGPGSTAVAGTVTLVGTTATFTPTSTLAASTTFTATISVAAKDLAGNAMAAAKVWSFTTGAAPDVTPPTVVATSPADNDILVDATQPITATFSEDMNAATITTATVTVIENGGTPVAGTVSYDAAHGVMTFTPSAVLDPSTSFTVTISSGVNGVTDLAGNALASDFVWTFMTA